MFQFRPMQLDNQQERGTRMNLFITRSKKIELLTVLVLAWQLAALAAPADHEPPNRNTSNHNIPNHNTANRNAAELFAVLPDGSAGPEGLAVAPDGNVFVAGFGFNQNGSVTGP